MEIKKRLEELIKENIYEINEEKLDPLIVAREYNDEYIALISALFSYGNVKAIVKFLRSLDLKNLNSNESYYRFQTKEDVKEFLRWMVRDKKPDLGLWKGVEKKDLIIPLDTHTHKVSLREGLLKRKSYDLESAILLTNKLKEFDKDDPLKYDFVLYRMGQEKIN